MYVLLLWCVALWCVALWHVAFLSSGVLYGFDGYLNGLIFVMV